MKNEIIKTLTSFEAGVNAGINPDLLQPNQLAGGINTTVRGTFAHPRPPVRKIALTGDADKIIAAAFVDGAYQGGAYFRPDNASGSIVAAIAGHAFQFVPADSSATVLDRSNITKPNGDPTDPNPTDPKQAWMFQAEKWLIWNDGVSNPVYIDSINSVRSQWGLPVPFSTTTAGAPFNIGAIGASNSNAFTDVSNLSVGDIFTIKPVGSFQVTDITGAVVTFFNINATPNGYLIPTATPISWVAINNTDLPPGRMGVYGIGRIAMSLTDGQQFVMGDLVGGASGTQANNYRDSVLHITENLYLLGGGNFRVPGNAGDITAMIFTATMDVSLGQGPLAIFTPNKVFSCQSPVDRDTWSTVANPILTESVITNGGLSQWATLSVNSDILTRSIDGIRSVKLARAESNTWGTTPASFEIEPRLSRDSQTTLRYSSAIVFDNRHLMTTKPKVTPQGIYWQELTAMNFDPVSSLRGKAPSVYDALVWQGLNVFQLFVGQFSGVERALALCWNELLGKLELYELLKSSSSATADNGDQRIVWEFDSATLFQEERNQKRKFKRLIDGEMWIDLAIGQIDFQVWWKPDQWPCWVPWHSWSICATESTKDKLGFDPRMGFGEAPAPKLNDDGTMSFCDEKHDRALREFYTAQFRFVITGQCEFLGAQFRCVEIPQPDFAKPICEPICNQTKVGESFSDQGVPDNISPAETLPLGLIAYYRFETEGEDSSGNGLDLTDNSGNATFGYFGIIGNSMNVTGTGQYLRLSAPNFAYNGNTPLTICGWFRRGTQDEFTDIIGFVQSWGSMQIELISDPLSMSNEIVIRWGVLGTVDVTVHADNFSEWNFIHAYYNPVSMKFGVQVNNGTISESAVFTIPGGSTAGIFSLKSGSIHDLFADELPIYNRLLTADERSALWNSGNGLIIDV